MTSPFFIEQTKGIHFCIPFVMNNWCIKFYSNGHQLGSAGIFIIGHGYGSVDQVGQF